VNVLKAYSELFENIHLGWLSVRGYAIIHSQSEGCACAELKAYIERFENLQWTFIWYI